MSRRKAARGASRQDMIDAAVKVLHEMPGKYADERTQHTGAHCEHQPDPTGEGRGFDGCCYVCRHDLTAMAAAIVDAGFRPIACRTAGIAKTYRFDPDAMHRLRERLVDAKLAGWRTAVDLPDQPDGYSFRSNEGSADTALQEVMAWYREQRAAEEQETPDA